MKRPLYSHKACCERPFIACCFLISVICFVFFDLQASATDAAPVVVLADDGRPAEISEAAVLADRILMRQSVELFLHAKRRIELSGEIEAVLKKLKYAYPEVSNFSARASHMPGVLLLGVKPGLFKTVADLLEGKIALVTLHTGNRAFDTLNTRLGLRAVRPFRHTGILIMRFSDLLNVRVARQAYLKITGVVHAEPDAHLGDGSDIEASKTDGVWHIVVRKAWGDCPSGCLYKKMFFFTVRRNSVDRIDPERAMESPPFRKILETRNWR